MISLLVSRLHRRRRLLGWIAAVFAAYSLAGFLLAPVILRAQLVRRGSAALQRPVAVAKVSVNPWTFSVAIRGLSITAHDGAEFAGWDELFVNFAPTSSLARLAWSFDEIRLDHPRARIYREADGSLNIADLIPPATPPAPAAPAARPPAVVVAHLRVDHGEFTYADKSRSAPFATTFGPTTFALADFTTRPNRSGAYTFAASTEAGERFAWQGNFTFEPLGSSGRIALGDIRLPKYAAFHRDLHQLDLLDGRLGVEIDYDANLAGAAPSVRVSNGRVTLADLKLAARGTTTPLAVLPLVEVDGLAADSAKREASIATVRVRDADLSATRRADGSIDWLTLLQPPVAPPTQATAPAAAPNPEPQPPSPAFSATLGRFEIANATVRLHDLTNPRPVDLVVDQLGLTLTGAGTQLDKPVTLAAALRWNGTGRITAAGNVTPQPLAADLQLDLADIELRPLDPYLAPFLDVLITGGAVRAQGRLTFALAADGAPDLRWTGNAGLAGFATVDGVASEPLVGFADLALNNIRATTQPLAVSLDEIVLKEPFAHVVVLADKRLNVAAILRPPAAGTPPPAAPAARPLVTIGRVTLAGARFTATDRSVAPAFTTALTDFGGTISGLSSEQLARADVELTGRLGLAPLKISGQINPLSGDAFTDVKVAFTGIELPPFTPYSGKFAGYTIDKGKLSLDLAYHLSARELVAENNVVFDQFYFGGPVESPDAVKLPLKLALAILRDRDGRIPIDLPIRGNLDDPDFKYGKVVWHALGNLVVKAATAPFALLGGLFGGGHDLSAVDFASGSADLDPEACLRLDGLIKALTERPGLSLEISSQPQRELDLAGLRDAQLAALLRARKVRELAAASTAAIDPATVQLTPEETARHLAALHAERCPVVAPGTEAGATPAAPVVAPAAPPAKRNLVVRTLRRLFVEPPPAAEKPTAAPTGPAGATAAAAPAALTPEELRAQVLATLTPSDSDYAALAAQRAQRIQEYLLTKGQIPAARVFLATEGIPPATGAAPVPRVVFNLQ